MPPEINEYAFERALNSLRRELTGKNIQLVIQEKIPQMRGGLVVMK